MKIYRNNWSIFKKLCKFTETNVVFKKFMKNIEKQMKYFFNLQIRMKYFFKIYENLLIQMKYF